MHTAGWWLDKADIEGSSAEAPRPVLCVLIEEFNLGHKAKSRDCRGRTPLHALILRLVHVEYTVALIRESMDWIESPIDTMKHGINLLIAHGADVHARCNDGDSPLDIAQRIKSDYIRYFLQRCVRVL